MQQRAFCLFASEIGNATQNSNGIWLKSVQPPWSSTFQQSNQRWPAVAISPKIASVVNNVPRPTTIPENAKRIAGVYIAPPKRCIFCIMTGNPPLFIRSAAVLASLETADAPFACTSCNRTGGPASLTSCTYVLSHHSSIQVSINTTVGQRLIIGRKRYMSSISPAKSDIADGCNLYFFSTCIDVLVYIYRHAYTLLQHSPPR